MCGIIGLYGDDTNVFPLNKKSFMTEGLVVDSIRGYDATGVAYIPRAHNKEPRIYKKAMAGYEYVCMKPAAKLIDDMNSSVGFIGHNRAGTRGEAGDGSAHPFQHGHITLVHNGTVENASTLEKEWLKDHTGVDSEQVAWAFAQYGASHILPKLRGGYSLVWWDSKTRTLNFARNDRKPMYWAFAHKEQMLYYGSEVEMLMLLARRNNLELAEKMFATTPMVHYVFKNPKNVRKFDRTEYKEEVKPVIVYQGNNYRGGHFTNNPPYNPPATDATWKPSAGGQQTGTGSSNNTKGSSTTGFPSTELNHPIEQEIMQSEDVTPIVAKELDEQRLAWLWKLADTAGIPVDHSIVVRPYMWKPYKEGRGAGVMFCCYQTKRSPIQVFDITSSAYQEIVNGNKRAVVVNVTNFRNLDKVKDLTIPLEADNVFTAYIDVQKTEKYLRLGQGSVGNEQQGDPGHKADASHVEIGTSRKRLVTIAKFTELVGNGCLSCSDPLDLSDLSGLTWVGAGDDKPVCEHCGCNEAIIESLAYTM
jgi:predicted glutamine amidotransferase